MSVNIQSNRSNDYLHLVNQIIQDLQISEQINQLVPYDSSCRLSPGEMVRCLLLDILTTQRAVVHLETWARHLDIGTLFPPPIDASCFNNDAIARHIDRIHKAGVHKIVSRLLLHIFKEEGSEIREEHEIPITEVENRSGNPYQFTADSRGICVLKDHLKSGKTWDANTLLQLQEQAKKIQLDDFIYVADEVSLCEKTLAKIKDAGGFLLLRGKKEEELVQYALSLVDQKHYRKKWSKPFDVRRPGQITTYRVQEHPGEYRGHRIRMIAVECRSLEEPTRQMLETQRKDERKKIETIQAKWKNKPFSSKEEAQKVLDQWKEEHPLHFFDVTFTITQTEQLKNRKGRPSPSNPPRIIPVFHILIEKISAVEDWFQKQQKDATRFVLLTNLPDRHQNKKMDAAEIVEAYTGYRYVDALYPFFRDPVLAHGVYSKKHHRNLVLAYLILIALLVYRVFQKRVKATMREPELIGATSGNA